MTTVTFGIYKKSKRIRWIEINNTYTNEFYHDLIYTDYKRVQYPIITSTQRMFTITLNEKKSF